MTLHGASLPPGTFALLLTSRERAVLPGYSGGQGTLCLGGVVGRHTSQVAFVDVAGTVTLPFDTQVVAHPTQPFALVRGDTLNFQLWFRDLAGSGAASSNLSDGLSITFCAGPLFDDARTTTFQGFRHRLIVDLDGDGLRDIVGQSNYQKGVLWGEVGGGFSAVQVLPDPTSIGLVDAADFDGNGRLDLLAQSGNSPSNFELVAFLQEAPRTFAGPTRLTGPGFAAGAVGDVDGDGDVDLVVTSQFGTELRVLLGDGQGRFALGPLVATGTSSFRDTVLVDIENDGDLDVLAVRTALVPLVVCRQTAPGVFSSPDEYVVTGGANAIRAADLDGDGRLEIIVPGITDVSVLSSRGDGTLTTEARFAAPLLGRLDSIEDVDGSGALDLVYCTEDQDLLVLWNSGANVLFATGIEDLGDPYIEAAYVDVDGDGRFEGLQEGDAWLDVRARTGPLTIAPRAAIPLPPTDYPWEIVDVDGDGSAELVDLGNGRVSFRDYSSGWTTPIVHEYLIPSAPGGYQLGDVGADGDRDIVQLIRDIPGFASTQVVVHEQTAPFAFVPHAIATLPGDFSRMHVIDVSGDGTTDILAMSSSTTAMLMIGLGGVQFSSPLTVSLATQSLSQDAFADVTGDGRADYVYSLSSNPSIRYRENLGGGSFGPQVTLSLGPLLGRYFHIADLDGDGDQDIVTWHYSGWDFYVHLQTGSQIYAPAATYHPNGTRHVVLIDVESDGDLDVVTGRDIYRDGYALLANRGDGTFDAPQIYGGLRVAPMRMYCGDLDHDGDADVLLIDMTNQAHVCENHCR